LTRTSREGLWTHATSAWDADAQAFSQHDRSRAEQIVKLGELAMCSTREGDIHAISLTGEIGLASAADVEQDCCASRRRTHA